ncbi:Ca(2+)-dependent cysteine protease [Tulasnella sp. 417]|nr:Ca(2+)-dependent cysteine protease [Tulasnella sp. 417]
MPLREENAPKRKMLVISLSAYTHDRWPELHGPPNDWKIWAMLGMMSGWSVEVVADSLPIADAIREPTKDNIRRFIRALLKDNKAGDQLILVFSGHGGTEGLVLADGSFISHQELRTWLVQPLNSGSTLWTFFDCCDSRNILGLPHEVLCDKNQPLRYQPEESYIGREDPGVRGTVISIGSAAGPSGEMDLSDPEVPTPGQSANCGPLAWTAYKFFCSEMKGREPLLANFWSSLMGVLGHNLEHKLQVPQITTSSMLHHPVLPMLQPLPANTLPA